MGLYIFRCRYMYMEAGRTGLILTVYEIALTFIVFCHFLAATCIDPGKYPKGEWVATVMDWKKKVF